MSQQCVNIMHFYYFIHRKNRNKTPFYRVLILPWFAYLCIRHRWRLHTCASSLIAAPAKPPLSSRRTVGTEIQEGKRRQGGTKQGNEKTLSSATGTTHAENKQRHCIESSLACLHSQYFILQLL